MTAGRWEDDDRYDCRCGSCRALTRFELYDFTRNRETLAYWRAEAELRDWLATRNPDPAAQMAAGDAERNARRG